jgi:hypothetical protein
MHHKHKEDKKEHSHKEIHDKKEWHHNKPKHKDHFAAALLAVIISMTVFSLAFMGGNGVTGYAVNEQSQVKYAVIEFNEFKDIATLSPGNYYVNNDGLVYWLDEPSLLVVAKVNNLDEFSKSRKVYVDKEGNIGYPIS